MDLDPEIFKKIPVSLKNINVWHEKFQILELVFWIEIDYFLQNSLQGFQVFCFCYCFAEVCRYFSGNFNIIHLFRKLLFCKVRSKSYVEIIFDFLKAYLASYNSILVASKCVCNFLLFWNPSNFRIFIKSVAWKCWK